MVFTKGERSMKLWGEVMFWGTLGGVRGGILEWICSKYTAYFYEILNEEITNIFKG